MPITLQTPDRLNFRSTNFLGEGAFVALDKTKKRAIVYRLASIVPWWRDVIALSEIEDVKARKRERDDGTAVYGIALRRRGGDSVRFNCRSRDEAMRALQAIAHFLGSGHAPKPDDGRPTDIPADLP